MQTSQRGIDLIKQFEGLRLTAYDDGLGVQTIGYGHTADVKPGMTITEDQAVQFLREDLHSAERDIDRLVTVHLCQHQFDALASLVFNIGGTVSHSGGVPTGAIIERGSNANGEYVRFADGTQICTARVTGGHTANAGVTRTWSAQFNASPFVVCSAIPTEIVDNTFAYFASYTEWTFTSTMTTSNVLEAIGVGRWY